MGSIGIESNPMFACFDSFFPIFISLKQVWPTAIWRVREKKQYNICNDEIIRAYIMARKSHTIFPFRKQWNERKNHSSKKYFFSLFILCRRFVLIKAQALHGFFVSPWKMTTVRAASERENVAENKDSVWNCVLNAKRHSSAQHRNKIGQESERERER